MPRSFSTWGGRRPDPKLFSVPSDSTPTYGNAVDNGGRESLDVDLQTLVDQLLGGNEGEELPEHQQQNRQPPVDAATVDAAVASAMPLALAPAPAGAADMDLARDSCGLSSMPAGLAAPGIGGCGGAIGGVGGALCPSTKLAPALGQLTLRNQALCGMAAAAVSILVKSMPKQR